MKLNKKYISVIITYHNEIKNIRNTLKSVTNQSLRPAEIIFINSGSKDDTNKVIDNFIKKNKKYNIKNLSLNTNFPSTSKNLGIQVSKYDLLAFLDCGLKINKDWLEEKLNILIKNNLDAVISSCKLSGDSNFDKSCIANTYGLENLVECIPGSIIKKKVFNIIGFFSGSRSFYDVYWKRKFFNSKFKYKIDYKNFIKYSGTNYAINSQNLFFKSSLYISDSFNLYKNYQVYFYLLSFFSFIFLFFYNPFFALYSFFLYLVIRLLKAYIKSTNKIFFHNIKNFFNLAKTAIIIDIGRLIGSFNSLLNSIKLNFIILTFLLTIIIFNSPVPYIFESHLGLESKRELMNDNNYDAIVVFSGDGNISYSNQEFKDRALEALNIYKNNTSIKKLILSSGRENKISDQQIIRNFLLDSGISNEKIYVFNTFPASTYENVKLVGNYLKINNFNKIIFLTNKIHSKRSILIWNKHFPRINIKLPERKTNINWRYEPKKVLSLAYEYLAILHNYFKGYL